MQKRPALIVLGWLVAAASAVAIGVVAVSLLGDSITGAPPEALSGVDVAQALERTPAPTTTPASPGAPATTTAPATSSVPPTTAPATQDPPEDPSGGKTGQPRGFGSAGGQVVASCRDGSAYLESWSPAQGFVVDDVDRGSDGKASLTFKSGDNSGDGDGETEIEIEVHCADGGPVAEIEHDD